ncbi:acyl-CoA thioesterase [Sphingomonas montana]|uniref:acyl-CoA thioesterase n=1 Tax=Sphingomonas montana TaxID=1843236 RepID=UPI00097003C2|nr:hotdog domain-containing protein [Sphingomonas montana]
MTAAPDASADTLAETPAGPVVRLIDMVFPGDTNHRGTLFGGDALAMLGKAAFIAATRHTRGVMVRVASRQLGFRRPVRQGALVELTATIVAAGRTSVAVGVTLVTEDLASAARHHAASAEFVMVAVDAAGRPLPWGNRAAVVQATAV